MSRHVTTELLGMPSGWRRLPLGDVVTIGGGQVDPGATPTLSFNYLSLENIEAGTGRIVGFAPTTGREIGSVKTSFKKGELLYCRLRPYLQKVVIAPFNGIATTDVLPLQTHETIDAAYLRDVLLGPQHLADVTRLMSGARMPRVRSDELLRVEIPVPPLADQRRIVRALAVIGYRIANIRRQLEDGLALADEYEASLLSAAYTGELSAFLRSELAQEADGKTLLSEVLDQRRAEWEAAEQDRLHIANRPPKNDDWKERYPEPTSYDETVTAPLPASWTWASLAQLSSSVSQICYGVVETGDEVEDGVLLIRTQDLQDGTVALERMRRIAPSVDEAYPRSRVFGGEILASLVGTIGRIAVVPEEITGANINRALAKVTPATSVPSAWLAYALESSRLQDWMHRGSRGAARNILNLSLLAQAPIPLAPAAEMTYLIRTLEMRRASLRSLRQQMTETISATEAFWVTVRAQVFDGQLAIEDPSDQLVAMATIEQPKSSLVLENARKEGRKFVNRKRLKGGDRSARKLDLAEVLKDHVGGLDPLRLLEEAGYGLDEVEAFYKALADAISEQHVREERPDPNSALLVLA